MGARLGVAAGVAAITAYGVAIDVGAANVAAIGVLFGNGVFAYA